jgi:ribosomal RNA methyltransferase Nop2
MAPSKKRALFEEEEEEGHQPGDSEQDRASSDEVAPKPTKKKASSKQLTHRGAPLDEDDFSSDDASAHSSDAEADGDDTEHAPLELPASALESAEAPADVAARVKEIAAALSDFSAFKKRTKSTQSRSELVEQLARDCTVYYGYLPELVDMFLTLFGPSEMVEFLEANETARPTVIRANTLKTSRKALAQALTARGVGLEPVGPWTNVGLKVFESTVPVGATPEYLAGHYMLQSASSLTPVIALAPQPGEKVLDMCASPGGKTTHIAQLMKNKGTLIANDAKKQRMGSLAANLARMGVSMASCVNHDGRDFPKVVGGFDRVLLDAPCSGLGVISHDASVKQSRTMEDIQETAHLQKQLLLAAIDSCKVNGVIVYSTCSISVQENEQVVQYALEKRHVKLVDAHLEFGRPGLVRYQGKVFHPSLSKARRFYPHSLNMDGFFVCKLVKLEAGERTLEETEQAKQQGRAKPAGDDESTSEDGKTNAKPSKRAQKQELRQEKRQKREQQHAKAMAAVKKPAHGKPPAKQQPKVTKQQGVLKKQKV